MNKFISCCIKLAILYCGLMIVVSFESTVILAIGYIALVILGALWFSDVNFNTSTAG
jgi:hypothetical protein